MTEEPCTIVTVIDPSSDALLAQRLLRVQHDSYRVEAELIGVDTIPQLHETLEELIASRLDWIAVVEDEQGGAASGVLGALAWTGDDEAFEVERLIVSPAHFRRGIARALVTEGVALAAGRPVSVSTGRDNPPARRLYESVGFVHAGDVEVAPGVHLARYELR